MNTWSVQCLELESPEQILSSGRLGFRDDCDLELITRCITTLEQAYQLVIDHQTDFRNSSKTTTAIKSSYNRSFPDQSKPVSNTSSVKLVGLPSTNPTTFKKKTASEPVKVSSRTQCYRCKGYGHLANQYFSQTKTFLVEILIKEDEEEDGL